MEAWETATADDFRKKAAEMSEKVCGICGVRQHNGIPLKDGGEACVECAMEDVRNVDTMASRLRGLGTMLKRAMALLAEAEWRDDEPKNAPKMAGSAVERESDWNYRYDRLLNDIKVLGVE